MKDIKPPNSERADHEVLRYLDNIRTVSSQFDRRLFRSNVHSIETKGQFDGSKGCFDRRVNHDKNYSFASVHE